MKMMETDNSRRTAMCEWAKANGLDPAIIDEWVNVVGDTIHYRQIVTAPDGSTVWADRRAALVVEFPVDEYRLSTR